MSTAEFELRYEGPALDVGYMDARDLAPTLMAVSDLLREANRIANGNRYHVQVNVHAGFQSGSFGIEFGVELKTAIDAVSGVLDTAGAISAEQLLAYLGISAGGVTGLWQLVKRLKGKRVKSGDVKIDGDNAQVFTGDNQKIVVNRNTINMYGDMPTRRNLESVARLLGLDGVEKLEARRDGKVVAEIEKDDHGSYAADEMPLEENMQETIREALLQVNRPVLEGDYVWHVSEFGALFSAKMLDSEFRKRVENGNELFAAGNVLRVRLKCKPRMTERGRLTADFEILEVLEHREQPYRQRALTDGESD